MWTIAILAIVALKFMRPSKQDFIKWVKKWEGGKSSASTDSASNVNGGAPGGVHTNKGIQWIVYKHYCKVKNRPVSSKEFLDMPDAIWDGIFNEFYWNPMHCDKIMIREPFLAFYVCQFAWGSGLGGAEAQLAKFQRQHMGVVDTNITKQEIANNFVITPIPVKILANKLIDFKLNYYKSLGQPANLKGWTNRIMDFKKNFMPSI